MYELELNQLSAFWYLPVSPRPLSLNCPNICWMSCRHPRYSYHGLHTHRAVHAQAAVRIRARMSPAECLGPPRSSAAQ